jgi:hypothetical protein
MKRLAVIGAAAAALSSSAQVVLTGPSTYYQDFNSLASFGTGNPWTNNLPTALMPGWYSNMTTYDADDGTLAASGQYSYGNNNSTERALGSVALPGALIVYGMRLNNGSTTTFGSLNVDYTGEQWRSGSVLTDVLQFEYSTNATSLFSGTWTAAPALDFNSPNNSGAGAINGNLAANQSMQSSTITGLNWTVGTDMWVRWKHVGNASRHGMAIDDVHVKAGVVPEPSTMVAIGVACVGLLRSRRRISKG